MKNNYFYSKQKIDDLYRYCFKHIKIKQKFEILIYFVASIIGKLFVFTSPIFEISDLNIGKMVTEIHSFTLGKVFDNVRERYFDVLLLSLIKRGIALGLVLLFAGPVLAPLFFEEFMFGVMFGDRRTISTIAISILLLFYIVVIVLQEVKYSGTIYALINNKKLSLSDAIFLSRKSYKNYRSIIIKKEIIMALFFLVYIAGVVGLCCFMASNYGILNPLVVFLDVVIFTIGLAWPLFLFLILKFFIKKCICYYMVFKDNISLSKPVLVKKIGGFSVKYVPLDDFVDDVSIVNESEEK